jgi:hypothetical protein
VLSKQVWAEPIRQLVKKHGVSDGGIHKLCVFPALSQAAYKASSPLCRDRAKITGMVEPEAAVAIVRAGGPKKSVLLIKRSERKEDSWSGHFVGRPGTGLRECLTSPPFFAPTLSTGFSGCQELSAHLLNFRQQDERSWYRVVRAPASQPSYPPSLPVGDFKSVLSYVPDAASEKLVSLTMPVAADLFFSDNLAALRSLGPAHVLRHQC